MKKIFSLQMIFTLLFLMGCARANERSFDPAPYLGQAFQALAAYEQTSIEVLSGRYIYVEEKEASELAVMYLFVSFKHQNDNGPFYAMVTIYVNPKEKTYVDSFIDRVFNDELNLTISSAQSYENMYQAMLLQAESFPDSEVYLGDLTAELIQKAS